MVMVFYLLSVCSFLFGFLQTRSWSLESFTRHSFWIFVFFLLLILFNTPVFMLAILNFAAGYVLFIRNYYLFEPYGGKQSKV